jgi:hypothetical protein
MAIFDPSQFKPDNLSLENFPLGRHVVFISDAKPHTSKSGSQAIEIDFYIHDPASPHKGRSLRFSKFWTSEKALPRLANLCRACATPVAAFDLSDPAAIEGALIDQILSIEAKAKILGFFLGETFVLLPRSGKITLSVALQRVIRRRPDRHWQANQQEGHGRYGPRLDYRALR